MPDETGDRDSALPAHLDTGRPHPARVYDYPLGKDARFFTGLDTVEPGLQVLPRWRPDTDPPTDPPTDTQVAVYGAVARKP